MGSRWFKPSMLQMLTAHKIPGLSRPKQCVKFFWASDKPGMDACGLKPAASLGRARILPLFKSHVQVEYKEACLFGKPIATAKITGWLLHARQTHGLWDACFNTRMPSNQNQRLTKYLRLEVSTRNEEPNTILQCR